MKIQFQLSESNSVQSESATKKQQANAKVLFGTKGQTILTALESVSKNKILDTNQVDGLLAWMKASDAATVETYAGSASGKKLDAAAKKFAANKGFEAKLDALKAIKFKAPATKTNTFRTRWVKLTKRGPYKIEHDLSVEMRIDGSMDTSDPETASFVSAAQKLGLGIELIELEGPGGGNPLVYIHGTKRALSQQVEMWDENLSMYELERA